MPKVTKLALDPGVAGSKAHVVQDIGQNSFKDSPTCAETTEGRRHESQQRALKAAGDASEQRA